MSSKHNSSIYILISLLLVVGILIFVFRSSLLSYLSNQVFGEAQMISERDLKPSANSVIELNLLEKEAFNNLDDKVLYFDFNIIGKPVANNETNTNLPTWKAVYRGNYNPFFKPKVEENINPEIEEEE
ncbi:MAG: hypothetical protein RBT30_03460 [Patescibacteria group bacterium]|jgi:hypothetical protein|nr:hypothetical protein [Patescibacteria group bacterium]